MESNDDEIVECEVFVGLIRPAMAFGIPLKGAIIESFIMLCFYLFTHKKIMVLIMFAIVHGFLMFLTSKDPGIFEDIFLMKETGRRKHWLLKVFWGCNSLSPVTKKLGARN